MKFIECVKTATNKTVYNHTSSFVHRGALGQIHLSTWLYVHIDNANILVLSQSNIYRVHNLSMVLCSKRMVFEEWEPPLRQFVQTCLRCKSAGVTISTVQCMWIYKYKSDPLFPHLFKSQMNI